MGDRVEREAQEWIEAVVGERFEGSFAESLKDGVILCKLINTIRPGSVAKINNPATMPFKKMENIVRDTRRRPPQSARAASRAARRRGRLGMRHWRGHEPHPGASAAGSRSSFAPESPRNCKPGLSASPAARTCLTCAPTFAPAPLPLLFAALRPTL